MTGAFAILVLLDLSAAFDTVDHTILVSHLEKYLGIQGVALQWFKSYLSNRSFTVNVGEFLSTSGPFTFGVLQGSILAPLLFSLFMLPLGSIFKKNNVSFHCYADDMQIYLPLQHKNKNGLTPILECLNYIEAWMSLNFLKLNVNKTEIIIFGQSESVNFGPLVSYNKKVVKNIGDLFG